MFEPSNQSVVSSICHNVVYIVSLKLYQSTGIYNYEEYLLARDRDETDRERTNTLKRSTGHHHHTGTLMRDQEKMEKLKRKLHTDDDSEFIIIVLYILFFMDSFLYSYRIHTSNNYLDKLMTSY